MIFFTVKCTFPSANGKVHTRSPLPHSGGRSRTRLPAERTIAAAQPRPFFVNLCVTVTGGKIPSNDIHTHRTAPDTPERRALRTFRLGSEGALPDRPLACGLHPWDAGRPDAEQLVERLAAMPCDAIGEIGLDYVRTDRHDPRPVQLFDTQLAMAIAAKIDNPIAESFKVYSEHVTNLVQANSKLEKVLADKMEPKYKIEAMNAVRAAVDTLEKEVDDDLWPLPKYSEMLFVY